MDDLSFNIKIKKKFEDRVFILFILVCVIFIGLVLRLFFMQIINGQTYLDNLSLNIVKKINITAPRGNIFDRYGCPIAKNKFVYNIKIDQSIHIKNGISLNKPPAILRNDIFKLDKNFLREISPINNYILKKKKLNKYKNSFMNHKKSKNSCYFKLNKTKNSNIKLKKFDCDIFNNKSELQANKTIKINNCKKMSFERANSFLKFNTLKI